MASKELQLNPQNPLKEGEDVGTLNDSEIPIPIEVMTERIEVLQKAVAEAAKTWQQLKAELDWYEQGLWLATHPDEP